MANKQRDEQLLREFVQILLREDDGGAVAADLMGGAVDAMPYGMSYGSGNDLYKVFVEPFVDVFKVASGKTKELSVKTQTLGKTVYTAIASAIIPSFADNYEQIFAEEKKQLEKIKREYKDVYDRVWAAFEHEDVKVLAFFYDPFATGAILGYFGGKAAINTALDVVDSLSGGVLNHLLVRGNGEPKQKSPVEQGVGGDVDESVIREAEGSTDSKKIGPAIKKALASDDAKRLSAEARQAVQTSLKKVHSQVKGIKSAKTLDDLTRLGVVLPKDAMAQLAKVPENERGGIEQQVLKATKLAGVEFYVKNLEGQVKYALETGVPKKSAYVRDYERVISQLKTLK